MFLFFFAACRYGLELVAGRWADGTKRLCLVYSEYINALEERWPSLIRRVSLHCVALIEKAPTAEKKERPSSGVLMIILRHITVP